MGRVIYSFAKLLVKITLIEFNIKYTFLNSEMLKVKWIFSPRDGGLIPGLGRCHGDRNGNPLQYSCLGNPMDSAAWRSTRSQMSQTRLRDEDFPFSFTSRHRKHESETPGMEKTWCYKLSQENHGDLRKLKCSLRYTRGSESCLTGPLPNQFAGIFCLPCPVPLRKRLLPTGICYWHLQTISDGPDADRMHHTRGGKRVEQGLWCSPTL